jgi:hypothetical protein
MRFVRTIVLFLAMVGAGVASYLNGRPWILEKTLAIGAAPVVSVDWSPDNAHLLVRSSDGTAGHWNIERGELLLDLASETRVEAAGYLASDRPWIVATDVQGRQVIWDARTHRPPLIVPPDKKRPRFLVGRDELYVMTSPLPHEVYSTNLERNPFQLSVEMAYESRRKGMRFAWSGALDRLVVYHFSHSGEQEEAASPKPHIAIIDLKNGKAARSLPPVNLGRRENFSDVLLSPDGKKLAVGIEYFVPGEFGHVVRDGKKGWIETKWAIIDANTGHEVGKSESLPDGFSAGLNPGYFHVNYAPEDSGWELGQNDDRPAPTVVWGAGGKHTLADNTYYSEFDATGTRIAVPCEDGNVRIFGLRERASKGRFALPETWFFLFLVAAMPVVFFLDARRRRGAVG